MYMYKLYTSTVYVNMYMYMYIYVLLNYLYLQNETEDAVLELCEYMKSDVVSALHTVHVQFVHV